MSAMARELLAQTWTALGGEPALVGRVRWTGSGSLPSVFAVTDMAAACVATAGLAVAELVAARHGGFPALSVDRRLASMWFGTSIRPRGWKLPPAWDPIAGDYQAADGWIRLHTNAPMHRDAALAVLGVAGEKEAVGKAVAAGAGGGAGACGRRAGRLRGGDAFAGGLG